MKTMLLFVGGAIVFMALTLGGAWMIADVSPVPGSVAFALAFVPGMATLVVVLCGFRAKPDLQLLVAFGGTGVRMAVALGGGYCVTHAWPATFGHAFWDWLILFYLGLLGLEVTLLVNAFRSPAAPSAAGAAAVGQENRNADHDSRGNA